MRTATVLALVFVILLAQDGNAQHPDENVTGMTESATVEVIVTATTTAGTTIAATETSTRTLILTTQDDGEMMAKGMNE